MQTSMTDQEKLIAYYKAAAIKSGAVRPPFVPARVRIPRTVRGDGLYWSTQIVPGEYDCSSNQYGAVSVKASNGAMLGVRINEFEPVTWTANPAAV